MPAGVETGSFVHGVLELTDFAAADLDAELRDAVAATMARHPVDVGDSGLLVEGLRSAIDCPLGALVEGTRLRDLRRSDRLDELAFELPLAGGENPCGSVSTADIAQVLRRHFVEGDPVAAYADRLEDPSIARKFRGYLTGSIDLVLRFSGSRLAIVDYKTNRLAPAGDANPSHYRPEALAVEMDRAHYLLQAIIYTVALHRYLRWRRPGYDPAVDFAGVLYLFLRGMSGQLPPNALDKPCGVWSWRPPAALIEDVSDALRSGLTVTIAGQRPVTAGGVQLARRATGLVRSFNEAGVLVASDVNVARCIARLASSDDELVLLGAAFAVRAPRLGHTCVDLDTIRRTADTDSEVPVAIDELPWPDAELWTSRLVGSALVGATGPCG